MLNRCNTLRLRCQGGGVRSRVHYRRSFRGKPADLLSDRRARPGHLEFAAQFAPDPTGLVFDQPQVFVLQPSVHCHGGGVL